MTDPGQSAEELFGEALELASEDRPAFLDKVCGHDPELRRSIEKLLLQDGRAGNFLAEPAFTPDTLGTLSAVAPAASLSRFQAGQRIADRFVIARFLARGGMGEVYEARDEFLHGVSVALKIIRPEIAADAASSSRFEQEVILARKVNHPNLCPIYEIYRCEQPKPPFLFLTMKLLEGDTLYARLKQSGKLKPDEAATICNQLLAGVAALHDGGIIHRDLKPNNVMLASEGSRTHVSIMDFGLARLHEAENTIGSGVIAGTPGYMAPELLRGERPTKATDLFALGIVLHEVLSGERPAASQSGISLSPALRTAQAPTTLVQAVESFLSLDPAIRSHAFSRVRTGQDSTAATEPSLRTAWLRGKRLWFVSAAATAVVLLGVAILLTPAPVSGPLESTQITVSAESKKGPIFTDGSRLYFDSRGESSAMAVGGGPIVPMSIFEPGMHILDISSDGSKVLGIKPALNDEDGRGILWTTSMLGGNPRKLTDHLARVARWSPDGRSVFFSDENTLYRIDANGQNLAKIWSTALELGGLGVSPDGRQLSVTVGTDFESHRLWILKADGEDAHPLPVDWPTNSNQYSGHWTPDGQHFLFSSDREGRANLYELVAPRWFSFWRKPSAVRITGNQIPILASTPTRDGKGVFVLGRMDEGAMRAYEPLSRKLVPFLDDLSMLAFVISPDRQWMAYSEYPSRHLWKSKLDGSEKVQLTDSYAEMQQWSPDGKWLVYSDWHNLYLLSADGGVPEKLTPDGPHDIAPTWSPDGKSIAFNYFPYPGRPLSIRILDLASRKISEMQNSQGYFWPSWSPDGKYLVAMGQYPSRLMLYSAETRTWKELHRFDVVWSYWVWAADSQSLYMSQIQGNNGIYHLTVPQGEWTKLTELEGVNDMDGFDSFLSLTPDGQPAIMSRTGVAQIYLLRWPH